MLETHYLPGERDSAVEVGRKLLQVATSDVAQDLIHNEDMGLVLNEYRQIVFANEEFMEFMGFISLKHVIGKRPGEVFMCIHHDDCESGCGTSEGCRDCRMAQSFERCINGTANDQGICRINSYSSNLDQVTMHYSMSPLVINERSYFVITLKVAEE